MHTPISSLRPAMTPLGGFSSKVVTDGVRFFCAEEGCSASGDTFQSIGSSHRKSSHPREKKAVVMDMSLGDALRELAEQADSSRETDALREQVQSWKTRALSAERQLGQLRKIMAPALSDH